MPKVKSIDWTKMPRAFMTKKQLKRLTKMQYNQAKLRREAGIVETAFHPILPNRDKYKLKHELSVLNLQIGELKKRQRQIVKDIKEIDRRTKEDNLQPVSLYALELEDSCYYVGMSFNVEKRFKQHEHNKGAVWTKTHKPIQIMEIRNTEFYDQDEVAKLEDDMTLEYALKYGSDKVRGGGYCQRKPNWPELIVQNEF